MPNFDQRNPSYGYMLDGDSVFFIFDLGDTDVVTDDRNGHRFAIDFRPFGQVAVAGDFSDWQLTPLSHAPRVFSQCGGSVPLSKFKKPISEFKFVIDTHFWLEPPPQASNVVRAGIGIDT